ERDLGGLGWHLVHRVMDSVVRTPAEGGGNVYTLVKTFTPFPDDIPEQQEKDLPMEIQLQPGGNAAIVVIAGSVDGLTADTLLETLRGYVDDGHVRLVADLSRVDYTSSAGLRALLATVKQARQRGGDLR